jgi:hypothetical protein
MNRRALIISAFPAIIVLFVLLWWFFIRVPSHTLTIAGEESFHLVAIRVAGDERVAEYDSREESGSEQNSFEVSLPEGHYQIWSYSSKGTRVVEQNLENDTSLESVFTQPSYPQKNRLIADTGSILFSRGGAYSYSGLSAGLERLDQFDRRKTTRVNDGGDAQISSAAQIGDVSIVYIETSEYLEPTVYKVGGDVLKNQPAGIDSDSRVLPVLDGKSSSFYVGGEILYFYKTPESVPQEVLEPAGTEKLARTFGGEGVLYYEFIDRDAHGNDFEGTQDAFILGIDGGISKVDLGQVVTTAATESGFLVSSRDGLYFVGYDGVVSEISSLTPQSIWPLGSDRFLIQLSDGLFVYDSQERTASSLLVVGDRISSISVFDNQIVGTAFDEVGRYVFSLADEPSVFSGKLPHRGSGFDIEYLDDPETIIITTYPPPAINTALNGNSGSFFAGTRFALEDEAIEYLRSIGINPGSYTIKYFSTN